LFRKHDLIGAHNLFSSETVILPSGGVLAVRQYRRGFLAGTIGSFWSWMDKPDFFSS
jgi:hypothetical protein